MKKSREDLSEKIIELIDQLYFSFVEFKKDLKPIGLLKWNAASRIIGVNLNTLEKNARALFVLCSKSKASENNDCFCFLTPKEAGKKTPINESDAKKNHYSPVFKKYEELSEESVKQMIKKSKLEVSFISYSNEQNKVVALSIKDYLTNNKRIRFEAFVKKLVIDILNCISYAKAFIASRE